MNVYSVKTDGVRGSGRTEGVSHTQAALAFVRLLATLDESKSFTLAVREVHPNKEETPRTYACTFVIDDDHAAIDIKRTEQAEVQP